MKPLELKIYPLLREEPNPVHDGWDAWRDWDNQIRDEYRIRAGKRLTEPELAAEYWAQDSKCRHEQWIETVRGDDDYEGWERAMQSRMYEQLTALHRFAALPHYDEVTA